jgi:PhoH-like ATPase
MLLMGSAKKIFILDTNVLLHDYECIYRFQDNDLVIPIVVLEELDKLKKGNDQINYHAREFTRELDKISGDKLFNGGIKLGRGLGKLSIETGKPFSEEIEQSFPEKTADHRILSITWHVRKRFPGRQVILISKDINLRIKAKSLGILSQDYESDKVADLDSVYRGAELHENIDEKLISRLYEEPGGVPVRDFNLEPPPHQYFIFRNAKASALGHYDPVKKVINRVEKNPVYGIEPRNAEQTFSIDALTRPEIPLISLTGKAGTGKTLLALAAALHQEERYNQVLLARPVIPLANRDIGFLPGDINEKIGPYMQPLYDNLAVIKNKFKTRSRQLEKIEEMERMEKLVITPLAYIRGRSLSDVFFIVDEAQNLTPHEIKTIITRAGENTKIVFTGDIHQIDSPYLDMKSNGLSYLTDKMNGQEIFAHVNLIKGERSYLSELASNIL